MLDGQIYDDCFQLRSASHRPAPPARVQREGEELATVKLVRWGRQNQEISHCHTHATEGIH